MTYAAGRNVLSMTRGDTATFVFACTSSPSAARFYARKAVDGTAIVALTLAANPTQFVYDGVAKTLTVTVLPANTDGQPVGRSWLYDLEITVAGVVSTTHWGPFQLNGDIATDAVTSTPAAAGYLMTAAEDAAFGAASSPSAVNPVLTALTRPLAGIPILVAGDFSDAAVVWAAIQAVTGWIAITDSFLDLGLTTNSVWAKLRVRTVGAGGPFFIVPWNGATPITGTVYIASIIAFP